MIFLDFVCYIILPLLKINPMQKSVYFKEAIQEIIQKEADERELSFSKMVGKILKQWIDAEQKAWLKARQTPKSK